MRIVLLSNEFPPGPGGIGTHAYQLAKNLIRLGHDLKVLVKQDYESLEEIERFNQRQSFSIHTFSRRATTILDLLSRRHELKKTIKSFKPEIVLASGDSAVYLAALSISNKIPWIAVEHGRTPKNGMEKILKRWGLHRASGIVCVSEYTKKQMLNMGVRSKNIKVIHNGINPEDIRATTSEEIESFRNRYGLKGRIITTVGNVSERKGQDIVIRALPEIIKSFPEVHYVIAGLPTKKEDYLKIADEFNVASHVHFLGKISPTDLGCLLSACEIFVMTSRLSSGGDFEGFGIAVIEAACYEKPAVVSRESGLSEAIIEGVTGLSVSPEDPDATANAVLKLLNNATRRHEMGRAAKAHAVYDQTWAQRAAEYESFLKGICESPN